MKRIFPALLFSGCLPDAEEIVQTAFISKSLSPEGHCLRCLQAEQIRRQSHSRRCSVAGGDYR